MNELKPRLSWACTPLRLRSGLVVLRFRRNYLSREVCCAVQCVWDTCVALRGALSITGLLTLCRFFFYHTVYSCSVLPCRLCFFWGLCLAPFCLFSRVFFLLFASSAFVPSRSFLHAFSSYYLLFTLYVDWVHFFVPCINICTHVYIYIYKYIYIFT